MQAEVRRVFLSYLSLLVNSKDDLALAHVLDIPGRALGRAAFTDLKHAARHANTSMFLVRTPPLGQLESLLFNCLLFKPPAQCFCPECICCYTHE
jgi:hypothetical protein